MRIIWILISIIGLSACGKAGKGTATDTVQSIHALCEIKSGATAIVCLDYAEDSTDNQSACSTTERQKYLSRGANSYSYIAVGSGATTSCRLQEPALAFIGSCLMSEKNVRFFTISWTVSDAQQDCTSRAGDWSN